MNLRELSNWGIPKMIIEHWHKRQGNTLLPVQSRAIRHGLLGKPGEPLAISPSNLVIAAPTSAGKSFCADLAIARQLAERRRSIYLVPLKSLAEERYEIVRELYAPLGVRCLIVTGEHPEHDRPFVQGSYDIAVAIYEKADRLVSGRLDAFQGIGLLVLDELQCISQPGRGALLERLITTLRSSAYHPQIIALSAVLGPVGGERLGRWLGAQVIEEHTRPVDLLCGVWSEDQYQYRSHNAGVTGVESFGVSAGESDSLEAFASLMERQSGTTLVFLKSRRDTIEQAIALAGRTGWPAATRAVEALEYEESSSINRLLRQTMSRGVAFHNADLTPAQRRIVEDAFTRKEVRVLFATTTLALGVNLAADTVFLEAVKYADPVYAGAPTLLPISRNEFDNMTGRAGRYRAGEEVPSGRAVVIARSALEREILWNSYIAPEKEEPVRSAFASLSLADWLLYGIVAGVVRSLETGSAYLQKSLHSVMGGEISSEPISATLEALLSEGYIESSAGGFRPTQAGRNLIAAGFSFVQGASVRELLAEGWPSTPLGWLALALRIPGSSLPPGFVRTGECYQRGLFQALWERGEVDLNELIRWYPSLTGGRPDMATLARIKAMLLLDSWRSGEPIVRLEEHYGIHHGQILAIAEMAGYLLGGMASLLEVSQPLVSPLAPLRELALSVRTGLPPHLHELHLRFGHLLQRREILALGEKGITSAAACAARDEADVRALIHGLERSHRFITHMHQLREEVSMHPSVVSPHISPSPLHLLKGALPESIEVDGSQDGERYLIRINGQPVRLTAKSFKYFVKLAWARAYGETGWLFKEEIEVGFNQARYLYRLKQEIAAGCALPWNVIENNRLGYYRLDLAKEQIHIRIDTLRNHHDYEIRKLVDSTTPVGTIN